MKNHGRDPMQDSNPIPLGWEVDTLIWDVKTMNNMRSNGNYIVVFKYISQEMTEKSKAIDK